MAHIKYFLTLSACGACLAQRFSSFEYENPTETYIGPSSYTTSFETDFSAHENFDGILNVKNPQISSSYSSYGPSDDNSEFGSTSYVNYPPSVEYEISQPEQTNSYTPSSHSWPEHSYTQPVHGTKSNSAPTFGEGTPISQHVEITNPIIVPIYKKFPYAVPKKFKVAIPHPVLVPIPAYYAVNVQISQPVATPVIREIRVPVEKEVRYPVNKYVPVIIDKPLPYQVEKHYPVYVAKPYPVKVPIVKTVIHKNPNRW